MPAGGTEARHPGSEQLDKERLPNPDKAVQLPWTDGEYYSSSIEPLRQAPFRPRARALQRRAWAGSRRLGPSGPSQPGDAPSRGEKSGAHASCRSQACKEQTKPPNEPKDRRKSPRSERRWLRTGPRGTLVPLWCEKPCGRAWRPKPCLAASCEHDCLGRRRTPPRATRSSRAVWSAFARASRTRIGPGPRRVHVCMLWACWSNQFPRAG